MKNIVLYIGSIFLPDKSAGAQRSLSLSKSFRDLGYRVVIVGMNAEQSPGLPVLESKGDCAGFETFSVAQPKTLRQWAHHTLSIGEFHEIIEHYGVDNIHSIVAMEYESVALWRLSNYCKKRAIHLIADAEEWYEHSRLPFPMNVAKNLDTYLRMHYVYPYKINNMICISRFFEKHYAKQVPHRVYIPGTIDCTDKKWKNIPLYEPNKVFTIAFAGFPGMQFEKERLDWLVKAVLELNREGYQCLLKIAGLDREFVEQRIPEAKESQAILCFGKISHTECLNMIATSDFSAIVREDKRVTKAGFPTKLSESFGCGTPVIATPSSNIAEYIIEDKTGFLCADFSKESVKAVLKNASRMKRSKLKVLHTKLRREMTLNYEEFTAELKGFLGRID